MHNWAHRDLLSTLRQKTHGDRRRGHDDEAQGLFPRGSSRPGGLSKRKSCIFLSQNFFPIIAARLKTFLSRWMIDTKNNFLSRSPSPTPLPKRAPARAEEGNPHPLHPPRNEHKNSVMNKTLRSRNAPRAPLLANGLPLAPATEETRAPVACVGLRAPTPRTAGDRTTRQDQDQCPKQKESGVFETKIRNRKKKKPLP